MANFWSIWTRIGGIRCVYGFNFSFVVCVNFIELIVFWQSIKICNLCQICREQPTQTPWRGVQCSCIGCIGLRPALPVGA